MTDPDDDREFTEAERRVYNPQTCPRCGKQTLWYEFKPSTAYGPGDEDTYMRGLSTCRNGECPSNDVA